MNQLEYYRLTGAELIAYMLDNYISDEELYKLIYRITDRFDFLWKDILKREVSDSWFGISIKEKIYTVLASGDNGTYEPKYTILTKKDMDMIRLSLEYAKEAKGSIKTVKEQQYQRLNYVYTEYKGFYLEYKVITCPLSLRENPFSDRLDLLGEMVELYEHELQPFMEIFAQPQQEQYQSKSANNCILPDKLIDEAVDAGLLERTENGLKWAKTAALYGYFVDKVSDKLNLKSSSGRTPWKSFTFIENHNTLLSTAKQAVNDYKNKGLNPPEGDDIVDRLLK